MDGKHIKVRETVGDVVLRERSAPQFPETRQRDDAQTHHDPFSGVCAHDKGSQRVTHAPAMMLLDCGCRGAEALLPWSTNGFADMTASRVVHNSRMATFACSQRRVPWFQRGATGCTTFILQHRLKRTLGKAVKPTTKQKPRGATVCNDHCTTCGAIGSISALP